MFPFHFRRGKSTSAKSFRQVFFIFFKTLSQSGFSACGKDCGVDPAAGGGLVQIRKSCRAFSQEKRESPVGKTDESARTRTGIDGRRKNRKKETGKRENAFPVSGTFEISPIFVPLSEKDPAFSFFFSFPALSWNFPVLSEPVKTFILSGDFKLL